MTNSNNGPSHRAAVEAHVWDSEADFSLHNNWWARRYSALLAGLWIPLPGSVAADLVVNHRGGRSPHRARIHIGRLVQLGVQYEGFWWLETLDTPVDEVSSEVRRCVEYAWHELGRDRAPFRKRVAA